MLLDLIPNKIYTLMVKDLQEGIDLNGQTRTLYPGTNVIAWR